MGRVRKEQQPRWILKLNPKGQATIPLEVRRIFGINHECREIELVKEGAGFRLRPHKPDLPVHQYIGFCAEELGQIDDPVTFIQELRGRDSQKRDT